MPFSISPTSLSIGDFEKFSGNGSISESAIVGKKIFGSGLKQISSLNFQWAFGGTSSIVADFQKALAQKYGKEIADFVFSSEHKDTALSKGLNKKTIEAVLKKAELISSSDFFSYREAFQSKQKAIEKRIKQSPASSASNAKQAYLKTKDAWENCVNLFNNFVSAPSNSDIENLKNYFQERLEFVDQLAREILPETKSTIIVDAERLFQEELGMSAEKSRESAVSLQEGLGDSLSRELIVTATQQRSSVHQLNTRIEELVEASTEVRGSSLLTPRRSRAGSEQISDPAEMAFHDVDDSDELKALYEQHPQLKQFLENLSLIPEVLKKNSDRLSRQLQPFVSLSATAPPENYFYLSDDTSQSVALHSPLAPSSPAASEKQQRAAAHRFFYALKEFYGANLIDSILSVEKQEQLLTVQQTREILHSLCNAFESLNNSPIIITPEYLATLAHNQEAAARARESHELLGEEGRSLVRTLREMGICGMILSGTKIGLAVAGVCTPTLPCIAVALVTAAVDGYVVGRLVTREEGLPRNAQHEAATVSAVSTTGSATGLIASRFLQPIIGSYVPEFVSSTVAEYSGSFIALALQEAARGGANSAATNGVFLEPRLVRWFQLEPYVERLFTSIGTFGGLMSGAPSSSSTPLSSSSNRPSTRDLTSS